jgi:hypothetical protein
LLSPWQRLPPHFFAAIGKSRLNETRLSGITNLDSTGEKKIADGIFPAISPDGPRVAFKAVRVTGKDDYVWEPFWLTANEFLCIMQRKTKESRRVIGCRWTEKIRSCL